MKTTNRYGWLLMIYMLYLLDKHKHIRIMNDYKFKIGDIVKLKSCSQLMTVNQISGIDKYIKCVWINSKGDNKSELYHEDALELAELDSNSTVIVPE